MTTGYSIISNENFEEYQEVFDELVAALNVMLACHGIDNNNSVCHCEACNEARAALARAKGEE